MLANCRGPSTSRETRAHRPSREHRTADDAVGEPCHRTLAPCGAGRGARRTRHRRQTQSARLSAPQAQTLAGDVAAIMQALVVLDQRYRNTPGWESLAQPARLGWAALATALDVGLGQPDYSIDQIGWRPKTKAIDGPASPGILGVLQAEHNLVVRLKSFPNPMNLRRIVDSQKLLSQHLTPYASRFDEQLAARWTGRSATYALIQQQLRDLGGRIGKGDVAAAEGANAVSRLRALPADATVEPRVLAGFETPLQPSRPRVADVIDDGVSRGSLRPASHRPPRRRRHRPDRPARPGAVHPGHVSHRSRRRAHRADPAATARAADESRAGAFPR